MRAKIHPTYFEESQVVCACGNRFTIGSTRELIHVELCSKCHPFYTGEQRFVDSASRIDKFKKQKAKADQFHATVIKKKEEKFAKEQAPKTLAEMLSSLK